MNDDTKRRLQKLDNVLIESLESLLEVKVFQDSISEDELKEDLNGIYHFVIFETGGMRRADNVKFTLIQDVLVRYYAENLDNLDEIQIDVISTLEKKGYYFINSTKGFMQKGKEDAYVDGIEFNFTRSLKYVC